MGKKIFIGNLAFTVTDDSLRERFASFGDVVSVKVVRDAETGRSRGFGFVEYSQDDSVEKAISETNGKDFEGRALSVSEARDRTDRPGGGGGGQRRSFGSGGGGGGRGPSRGGFSGGRN